MIIAGSPCPGLEVLLKLLRGKQPWISFKTVASPSSGGLAALKRGLADLAGIHLYDLEKKQYNLPFIKRYGLEEEAALYRGYLRRVGFLLPKGNPKGFRGIEDLLKPDVTFVNLSRNFEARTLLDIHLKKLAGERGLKPGELALKIKGYSWEARSPQAVVSILLHGKADVGLGVEAVAELHGLGFIPLATENYDFAVRLDRAEKPAVKAFLEVLSSEEFKEALKKVRGLQPTLQTGERIL
jgi:putative molybdopterin biosynthesis protein